MIYELRMWLQLWKCFRHGHHLCTTCTWYAGTTYCWTCFYNYPYSCWISWSQWLRNLIGRFL